MAIRVKKYMENYELKTRYRNGKTVKEYVYKGDWYVRELEEHQLVRESIIYLISALVSAGLLITAMLRPVATNMDGICAAMSLLALIPAFCVIEGSAETFFRRSTLKKENYQERVIMLRVMPAIGAGLLVCMMLGYLYTGLLQGQDQSQNLGAAVCAMSAAVMYGSILYHESKVRYRIIPGKEAALAEAATRNKEKS
jgi:positive regulator of sigma E activity